MSDTGAPRDLRPTVLVIDDERRILTFLRAALVSQGYRMIEAQSGESGVSLAASHLPDIILLDLGLPDIDGVEVLRRIRLLSGAPIIVLSARGQERDKVGALDEGADDYLTKPFAVGELLARIRVGLRRAARGEDSSPATGVVEVGSLRVDLDRRRVQVGEAQVHLTPTEYRLLACLVRYRGKVLTHNLLLSEVWGPGSADRSDYLRVYMAGLRRKIESDPANPRYLLTEVGVGYRLAEEPENESG